MLELLNPNKSRRVMAGAVGAARRSPHLVAHGVVQRWDRPRINPHHPSRQAVQLGGVGGGGREINRRAVAKAQSVIAVTYVL